MTPATRADRSPSSPKVRTRSPQTSAGLAGRPPGTPSSGPATTPPPQPRDVAGDPQRALPGLRARGNADEHRTRADRHTYPRGRSRRWCYGGGGGDQGGVPRMVGSGQRHARDGAGRSLAAVHGSGLAARRAGGPDRDRRDMRVKVEERRDAPAQGGPDRGSSGARRQRRPGSGVHPRRGARLGRQVPGDGDGDRAPRLDRPVPEPRAVRVVPARAPSTSAPTASSPTSPPPSPRVQRLDGRLRPRL